MDIFVPDIYAKNIYKIDYKKLKKNGIKCLLFDLDNTLAPLNVSYPEKNLKDFCNELQAMGFKLIILSNSDKNRVRPFKEHLNIDSSYSSKKPLKKKYKKIMNMYNFKDTEIACIGDQIFTDVLGANRMGFTSILVNQMSNVDRPITKVCRYFERKLFRYFEKRDILKKGSYYD